MYSDDPSKTTRLSTRFNFKTEQVSNWGDFSRLHCYPLKDYVNVVLDWPSNPRSFRTRIPRSRRNSVCLVLFVLFLLAHSAWAGRSGGESGHGGSARGKGGVRGGPPGGDTSVGGGKPPPARKEEGSGSTAPSPIRRRWTQHGRRRRQ